MAWQNEMSIIVRHLINDLDSSNYTFTDSRIEESILVSAQLVLHEINFDKTYTIDVDGSSLSPDPTTSGSKDNSFINLVSLKSATVLLGSELKTHSLNAIALKDGPSSLDLRGIVSSLKILFDDINKKYDDAKLEYKMNGIVGQAILGPYSPGSDAVARTHLGQRSGYFE
jgi:hypothetical protein|tara:strand:+ start:1222 stop:1731 length:510 start_codon:yes stop_codon:yes gene_type:complete